MRVDCLVRLHTHLVQSKQRLAFGEIIRREREQRGCCEKQITRWQRGVTVRAVVKVLDNRCEIGRKALAVSLIVCLSHLDSILFCINEEEENLLL